MSTGANNSKAQPKPPHQAQWNVQVVKGKVTTRCLWNACKALGIGLILLTIGTTMAVVGYYADQLSIRSEVRGNSTVKIKNESRGFHLNNLSYAGPIVMGIGGFIVVAACVMTFEARDSAAKVVPARFKPNLNSSVHGSSTKSTPHNSRSIQRMESKRNTSCQTGAGRSPGLYKLESSMSGSEWSPKNDPSARKAFTAAFVQFQRELMENSSTMENQRRWRRRTSEVGLNKSPSAPDLALDPSTSASLKQEMARNISRRLLTKASPKTGNRSQREFARPLDGISSNLLLRPNYLERQALSMDNPFYESYDCYTPPSRRLSRQPSGRSGGSRESFDMELGSSAGVSGSQTSMALDLHECQVTIKVKDESASKRSDTARRHQLLRQKPVEEYREEKPSRCCCASKYSCALASEDCGMKTNSSSNLKSPCHHCPRSTFGRGHMPKITADFRSQSFSQTCSYGDSKRCCCHEDSSRIFCIEDQKRKTNLSSENIRICCEEKLRCLKRHSPTVSPHRSPQNTVIECRVKRQEGGECLVHRGREIVGNRPLVRRDAKNKKPRQKIEGSLSAEDQTIIRELHKARVEETTAPTTFRSASFSPTRKLSSSNSSSRNNSFTSTTSFKSPSPVTVEECEKDSKEEEQEKQQPKEENTHELGEPQ